MCWTFSTGLCVSGSDSQTLLLPYSVTQATHNSLALRAGAQVNTVDTNLVCYQFLFLTASSVGLLQKPFSKLESIVNLFMMQFLATFVLNTTEVR